MQSECPPHVRLAHIFRIAIAAASRQAPRMRLALALIGLALSQLAARAEVMLLGQSLLLPWPHGYVIGLSTCAKDIRYSGIDGNKFLWVMTTHLAYRYSDGGGGMNRASGDVDLSAGKKNQLWIYSVALA